MLTREVQLAVPMRFFSVSLSATKVFDVVTEVAVVLVRLVVNSVVVVSIVVVVDVVDVATVVDESSGVTAVSLVVTGSIERNSRQNSTACSSSSEAQNGEMLREQVKFLSTP